MRGREKHTYGVHDSVRANLVLRRLRRVMRKTAFLAAQH
jgi:hypothetical protein